MAKRFIEQLKEKYPKAFSIKRLTGRLSEWYQIREHTKEGFVRETLEKENLRHGQ